MQAKRNLQINEKFRIYVFEVIFPEEESRDKNKKFGGKLRKIIFFIKIQKLNNTNSKKETKKSKEKSFRRSNVFPTIDEHKFLD